MNRKAVLPNVERMLVSAVGKRVAGRKRARRPGPGFAIIAFAALAIGGSALAATGVWNPFGGAPPSPQSATRQVEVEGPQAPPLRDAPIGGADSAGTRHGPSGDGGGTAVQPNVDASAAGPIAGQEPPTSNGSSPNPDGATGPAIGADPSKGGGRPVAPGDPGDPGNGNPGGGGRRAPGPTDLSLACGLFTEGEPGRPPFGTCRATVSGATGAPTGGVSFELSGGGQLSAPSCALADDGNGTSSSCSTNVTLSASGTFETLTATYGGDTANAPSSASRSVPVV